MILARRTTVREKSAVMKQNYRHLISADERHEPLIRRPAFQMAILSAGVLQPASQIWHQLI